MVVMWKRCSTVFPHEPYCSCPSRPNGFLFFLLSWSKVHLGTGSRGASIFGTMGGISHKFSSSSVQLGMSPLFHNLWHHTSVRVESHHNEEADEEQHHCQVLCQEQEVVTTVVAFPGMYPTKDQSKATTVRYVCSSAESPPEAKNELVSHHRRDLFLG